jgi:hypothetical protein
LLQDVVYLMGVLLGKLDFSFKVTLNLYSDLNRLFETVGDLGWD